MLLLISLTLLVVIVIFLFFLLNHKKSSLYIKGRILFVTAHPDDECMFFAPTFLALKRSTGVQIHLLCLTDGNFVVFVVVVVVVVVVGLPLVNMKA